jgi:hypothetical protein
MGEDMRSRLDSDCQVLTLTSNNVGSVKSFVDRLLLPFRRVFSFVSVLWPSVDNHGSLVIFRSVSVRPTHLFDPSFRP